MASSKNSQAQFVKLWGFSDEANIAVNKAIKLARDYHCESVGTVQLFIALLDKSASGHKFLNRFNIGYDDVIDAYGELAAGGSYGYVESFDKLTPDYMSKGFYVFCAFASGYSFVESQSVTCDYLFDQLLDEASNDSEIVELLENIGISINDLKLIHVEKIDIPRELQAYIEDMNCDTSVTTAKIEDVDNYVDEAFEVLSRKYKANPCLIGQAGVGKTSIVYSLVQRIVNGEAPDQFKNTHICYINSATLTAGTRYRGDFENRMKNIMKWATETDVVLFLDELHTFLNAGKGSEDTTETAGNMIKKALSDGKIKIIGATTIKEYHEYLENDSAFTRRLQTIEVKEPSINAAIKMIKNTISDYEDYHHVSISENIIELAVKLSSRYMKDKYLPDKAYTILDQAAAKAKLNHEDSVSESLVLEVVSKSAGVDVNRITESDTKVLLNLENIIKKSLIGQDEAVSKVSKAIRRSKAGVRDENRPIASFLFVGPTGVGKTELCKVLSAEVTPGRDSFVKVDMSEYSEKHSISKLIGSPPGYVGYGEGGQLTEKIKHNPYSVVLFDEIEKADPQIFNSMLQLLDEGRMTDGHGDTVDFTNCIIIMTSNAGYGADLIGKKSLGFGNKSSESESSNKDAIVRRELENTFRPEFLNRFDDIVLFNKLSNDNCRVIVTLLLDKLAYRIKDEKHIDLTFSSDLVDKLTEDGYSDKYGARNLKRKVQSFIEDDLAIKLLDGTLEEDGTYIVDYDKESNAIKVM